MGTTCSTGGEIHREKERRTGHASTTAVENQKYYNLCQQSSQPSSQKTSQTFDAIDLQDFHPFLTQYMKLLYENLNTDFCVNLAQSKTIERFPSLDSTSQEAARYLATGIQLLLSKKINVKEQTYKPLQDPMFSEVIAQLLVTSIIENTETFAKRAKEGSLPSIVERKNIPSFCNVRDYYHLDSVKMASQLVPSPYERLKELRPFLMDNSIRESTVAQIRGHIKSDKYCILNIVEETGIENIIVAAFGELPRVEDEWLDELHRENKMKDNFYAFTELIDEVIDGRPSLAVPMGLQKIIKFQVPNCIIEMDIGGNEDRYEFHSGKWKMEDHCELMKQRIMLMKSQVKSTSKVFFNFRNAIISFREADAAKKIVEFTVYLAKLPLGLRPEGLLFEEPTGELPPWQVRDVIFVVRNAMNLNGWKDGELLIHIHKNYGFCEAAVQEALAHGATGIWTGISEEGAGVGVGSSLLTLTNLARMGNPHVKSMVNFSRMYHAAKEICLITTGHEPFPKTELYGSRAMDILWNQDVMGVSEFDLNLFFKVPSVFRVTTFTSPEMFRQQLAKTFSFLPEDFEKEVTENMCNVLHEDLLRNDKFDYQTPTGLFDLYFRAGGKNHLHEMIKISNKHTNSVVKDDNALMLELRSMFDLYSSGNENGHMSYEDFFTCFISRFISHSDFSSPKLKAVIRIIDADKSGDIDWHELAIWAKWAIEEFKLTSENCDVDRLVNMVFVGHIFPVAFENLYKLKTKSKSYKIRAMSSINLDDEDFSK